MLHIAQHAIFALFTNEEGFLFPLHGLFSFTAHARATREHAFLFSIKTCASHRF